ncbi:MULTISPECIES: Ppx/GppA family phosphatase [Falsihalocynthiibacter]|uniref:Exopolyphosphatase n=1 Tax=Falsihalocynthiibacter arcticus TaxID=1579316 RepID=A0A126UVU1_9RHOB|nr:Ppx/GppA family phosphatase [Falsihalocynthiibacter arcticus]AML49987.1 exopolyphosphatase [Falsihalocynthiibacter arcticus]
MSDVDLAEDLWGPFGRPLFESPSAHALRRVGVVDVGSNSVRLVVFDGAARSPAYFYNEKIMCGLGAGLGETGRLNPEGRKRALAAIKRFQRLAEGMNIAPLTAVATAAVREAEDGPEFREEITRETGLRLFVIDGKEEARLSAQGVLLGWPEAKGLVCDIGGSSMELAELKASGVGYCVSSDLGPLKLMGFKTKKSQKAHIKSVIEDLHNQMPITDKRLFLVGGSWRAIARLDMERRNYPLPVLHEYRMTPRSVLDTAKWIAENDLDDLASRTNTSSERMALVPIASQVLKQLLKTFKPKEIAISSYGIREGMLYEQMPKRVRRRDPLIEACRSAEAKDARSPGFGRELYDFIMPLYKSAPEETKRLIKAACLLHDVSWRAHPDFRGEVCFDNTTRANLGGLKHRERIFLGLALLHRYKNKSETSRFAPLFEMLTPKQKTDAETLGKAMRFGAMFWTKHLNAVASLRFYPKKKELVLHLDPEYQDLFGEVAASRFNALASALESNASVEFSKG